MKIVRNLEQLRKLEQKIHLDGETIGFVPTMGGLHEGHLSLVDVARKNADKVVVSIFVNPAQFAPHEDFDEYPRTESEDLAKLEARSVDVVYLPIQEDTFPGDFAVKISVGEIGQILEGVARPHFFDGIALVVTKLFMQVKPDVAVFGEKDFQQLHIIKKLVQDLSMPVKILGGKSIREEDGLAMSSRNVYLKEKRSVAPVLFEVIQEVRDRIVTGDADALDWGRREIVARGFERVDYLELRDGGSLEPLEVMGKPAKLIVAAYLEGVRLLDNIEVVNII